MNQGSPLPNQGSPNGVVALLQQVIHNQTSQQQQIQLLSEQQQRQNQEQATLASLAMQLVGGSSAAAGFGLAGPGAPLSSFITPLQGQLLGEVWHSSSGRGVAAGTGRGRQSRGRDMPTAFTTAEGGFPLALAHLLWAPTAAVNFGGGLFLPELGLAGHGAPGSVPERDSAAPWLALHQRVKDTYLAYCYVESDPATDVPVVQEPKSGRRLLSAVVDDFAVAVSLLSSEPTPEVLTTHRCNDIFTSLLKLDAVLTLCSDGATSGIRAMYGQGSIVEKLVEIHPTTARAKLEGILDYLSKPEVIKIHTCNPRRTSRGVSWTKMDLGCCTTLLVTQFADAQVGGPAIRRQDDVRHLGVSFCRVLVVQRLESLLGGISRAFSPETIAADAAERAALRMVTAMRSPDAALATRRGEAQRRTKPATKGRDARWRRWHRKR